jgi:hypothetical protein
LILALVGWSLLLSGCSPESVDLPPVGPTQSPLVLPTATSLPTLPLTATATLSSTKTPAPTNTPTPRVVDMSRAVLQLEDLPKGFLVLDEATQAQLGITPDLLAQFFENTFHKSRPAATFAFHNADKQPFEVIIGAVFYPLETQEQVEFDRVVGDSEGLIRNFSQGFEGKTQALANSSKVGDASAAWTFLSSSGQASLKGEMLVFRHANAAGLLMTLFVADKQPLAPIVQIAPLFNKRIQASLGEN